MDKTPWGSRGARGRAVHVLYWPECSISRPGHRAHPGGGAWALLTEPVLRSLALRPTEGPPATGVSGDPPVHTETYVSPERRRPGPLGRQLPPSHTAQGRETWPPPFLIPAVRPALGLGPGEGHPVESWAVSCGVGAPSPLLRPAEHPASSGHTNSWLQGGGGVSRLPNQLCLHFISAEPAPLILPPKVRECRGDVDVAGPEVQSAGAAGSTEAVLTRGPWPGPCFSLQARGNLLQTAVLTHHPLLQTSIHCGKCERTESYKEGNRRHLGVPIFQK